MSCKDDLEILKAWLGSRIWELCARESEQSEMTQADFAELYKIPTATVSGIINRNPSTRFGEETWSRLVDPFGPTLEQALRKARRWAETEAGKRWLAGSVPSADLLPEPSANLRAAIEGLHHRGTDVAAPVVDWARSYLKLGDISVRAWTSQLMQWQHMHAARALHKAKHRQRVNWRGATDHTDPAHNAEPTAEPVRRPGGPAVSKRKAKKRKPPPPEPESRPRALLPPDRMRRGTGE